MFDLLGLSNFNDPNRQVAHDDIPNGAKIDTCAVHDATKPFETGVCDPHYNNGAWIIVATYDTREEAQKGHDKWVQIMTNELPELLVDVSEANIAEVLDAFSADPNDWRVFPRQITTDK